MNIQAKEIEFLSKRLPRGTIGTPSGHVPKGKHQENERKRANGEVHVD